MGVEAASGGMRRRLIAVPAAGWLPAIALSITAAAAAMSLSCLAALKFGTMPHFLLSLPTVALVAMATGFLPALASALLCAAWLHAPWTVSELGWQASPVATFAFLVLASVVAFAVSQMRNPIEAADAADERRSATERWLLRMVGIAVVLPLVLLLALSWSSRQSVRSETAKRLERIAVATQEHASKVLDTNEVVMGTVLDMVEGLSDVDIRARERDLHLRLKAVTVKLPQMHSIWLADAGGQPLVTGRLYPVPAVNIADRDYFAWRRDGREGAYVGRPTVGMLTKDKFFATSRARVPPDQPFRGIVYASLDPAYFSKFYAALSADEPGIAITLMRNDGTLLARYPEPTSSARQTAADSPLMQRIGRGERAGVTIMQSSYDDLQRLVAFRAVDQYPLVVVAGVDLAAIDRAWHAQVTALAALLFPFSAALVAAAWLALQGARRERRALSQVRSEVDQRLKAESALLRSQKLQALGQITGSVAHDFNNLLAVVNNCAHLITRRPPGTDARPQVAAIERAVRNGVQLTRQLLAFSRSQALRPEVLDLRATLRGTADLLRTSVSGRVKVEMNIAPDTGCVRIDPADLELALLNLVLNARDAMPEGGVVSIDARNDGEPDAEGKPTHVLIRVADNGTGIAPADLERVFEPFFTTKDVMNGTGLGLNQVRSALELAGGSVAIESTRGAGTTVFLRLPAVAAVVEVASVPADVKLTCTLLLVEDDSEVSASSAELLKSFGATVERAASAAEAIDIINCGESQVDIVLSDVAMPGTMNGLGLVRMLRKTKPELAIVLMTGFTSELEAAVAEGFTVLSKPVEPQLMVGTVAQAVKKGQVREAGSVRMDGDPGAE